MMWQTEHRGFVTWCRIEEEDSCTVKRLWIICVENRCPTYSSPLIRWYIEGFIIIYLRHDSVCDSVPWNSVPWTWNQTDHWKNRIWRRYCSIYGHKTEASRLIFGKIFDASHDCWSELPVIELLRELEISILMPANECRPPAIRALMLLWSV